MITVDTNVFVYLWDNDAPEKMSVAQQVLTVLSARRARLGLQVIGETQNALRRKLRQPPWQAAQNARNLLAVFDTFVATEANAMESLALMSVGRMNYWDALLITAARDAGCTAFLSEDLADGFHLGDLVVVNPFGPQGASDALQALLEK